MEARHGPQACLIAGQAGGRLDHPVRGARADPPVATGHRDTTLITPQDITHHTTPIMGRPITDLTTTIPTTTGPTTAGPTTTGPTTAGPTTTGPTTAGPTTTGPTTTGPTTVGPTCRRTRTPTGSRDSPRGWLEQHHATFSRNSSPTTSPEPDWPVAESNYLSKGYTHDWDPGRDRGPTRDCACDSSDELPTLSEPRPGGDRHGCFAGTRITRAPACARRSRHIAHWPVTLVPVRSATRGPASDGPSSVPWPGTSAFWQCPWT